MSDINSGLPVRTQIPGQSNYDDVVIKVGDGTTSSQLASVDTHGSLQSRIADTAGNVVTSQANGAQRALDVGIDVAGVQIDPRAIRALTSADVVSVVQSTSPWVVKDQSDGPVTPGTVASFSQLAGGQYNSTPPTLTTGQQSALQLTAAGALLVSSSSSNDTNYGTVGANTLRTAAQIGNATGAANFGAGLTTAQTLRVVLPTDQTAIPVTGTFWQATQPVSGTVAVTQSTSPWIVKDQADGSATGGAAGSFSMLSGGIYNSTPPTLTTGQQAALQLDATGRLITATTVIFPYDENWGTVGATTLRAAAQIGNATGAADFNFGTVGAQTLRAAAQIGNATGAADFNAGATSAQTLRVVANQGAPNTNANAWFTRITDGTNNTTVTAGGALNVTVASALPAGTNSIGTVVVSNFPTTVDTNWGVVGANTPRSAAEIGNATGAADFNNGATGAQTLRVAANLAVGGANVSATNPVPVSISAAPLGTPVNNYNTVAAVAAAASSNHIYTITAGKTFQGKKIWASASGLMKIEVRVSPDGSTYSTLWVGFNSTSEPNITIDMDEMVFLESGTGSTIEVIRTNLDKKAMDVYSTISGLEV